MLKNVPKILSPELIKVLCEMGHGDEIVIADANFPLITNNERVIRADGISGTDMLDAVLKVIPLDSYSDPNLVLMKLLPCDEGKVNPIIWDEYKNIAKNNDDNLKYEHLERLNFYERAKNAYAIIATGEQAIYANLIVKKGVIK